MQPPSLTLQKNRRDADSRRYGLEAANAVFGHKPEGEASKEAFIVAVFLIVAVTALKLCT